MILIKASQQVSSYASQSPLARPNAFRVILRRPPVALLTPCDLNLNSLTLPERLSI